MSLFKSKCSKSKLPNMKKIAEHSKVFCFKFNDICRQERHAVTVSSIGAKNVTEPMNCQILEQLTKLKIDRYI